MAVIDNKGNRCVNDHAIEPHGSHCGQATLVTCSLARGIRNLLQREPCKGAEMDSRTKFGKETVTKVHERPELVSQYGAQVGSQRAQDAQALLRLCSG